MTLVRAGIPSIKEPYCLGRSDGKRRDSTTLIHWQPGQHLVWDATVADTVDPTYLPITLQEPLKMPQLSAKLTHDSSPCERLKVRQQPCNNNNKIII